MFAARLRWSLCLASGMLFFANGCQDPNRPKLYPASGIVMHKDEPLTSGSLIFFPDSDAEYQNDSPTSMLQEDGAFVMKTFPFGNGVAAGKYKVCLNPGLAAGIKRPEYGDPKKTPWEIEITDSGITDILFETK